LNNGRNWAAYSIFSFVCQELDRCRE